MSRDDATKTDGDRLVTKALTPELAATELAGGDGDRSRTGPRVTVRHAEPHARAVGRFRVDEQLGSGGMGDVFRAYDTVLDRAVALKVLRTDRAADDGQRMRRVVREARAAAALVHPNAVTVFDVGEADGEVFIAMELLDGEDLRSVLERGDATLSDKLRWLLEAARALAAAHERGLVHRDVKPENMFVCKGGSLKLLDFGIAKRDDDEALQADAAALSVGPSSLRTTEGRRVGTPRYMAPEQHAGESTDARTDEYAWGLVAFELLTGAHVVADLRTMTRDGGDAGASPASSSERLDALRARAPEVPEAVAQAIARALEPRKEERFPSMAPIVVALENATDRGSTPRLDAPTSAPSAPAIAATGAPASAPPLSLARTRSRALLVALGLALTLVAGALLLSRGKVASRDKLASRDKVPGVRGVPPACRVETTRTLAVAPDDRLTILPTGALVLARDTKRGLFLEHDAVDGGMEPDPRASMFAALGKSYDDVGLRGIMYDGEPAILVELLQGDRGTGLSVATEKNSRTTRRIFGNLIGLATAAMGQEIVAITATNNVTLSHAGVNGIQAYVIGVRAPPPVMIEEGFAGAPAVATKGDRVGITYGLKGEIHFALLDPELQRLGDIMTVAKSDGAAVVTFAGDTATVFWTDDHGGKTRLTAAAFTPGDRAFSAPRVAIDEPLGPRRPVAARLPDGAWTIAWVASTGGLSALRVARVGAGAELIGPGDIAKAATIDRLQATSTDRGITFWWYEDDRTVRVASVSCALP